MEVCLINAPTSAEFGDPAELRTEKVRRESSEPQLGILNLAAVLEQQGCTPWVFDLNRAFYRYADAAGETEKDEFAQVAAAEIASRHAEVYGLGSICSAYPLTIRIAEQIKKLRPESVILLGGPQASVVSVQTLKSFSFVDFILRGEAEGTLPVFLAELATAQKFERVPGLTYRSPFGIQQNPDAPIVSDLDALPSPAYHLTGELVGLHRASLELGRGCPFACTFCSTNDFFRRKFRLRSPERMLKEMRAIESEYGIRDFDLIHDMFTVDAKRVLAFCRALIESGEAYTWSCSARTDCVNEELIEAMAAAGCKGMFFGVETGSERMQKIIDKHLDTNRAHEIIDTAERAGVGTTVSLITGFPQETWSDLRDTMRMFMHSARVSRSHPQLNILAPLANTPLHLQYKDQMALAPLCSDISHQGRTQNEKDMELIRNHPDVFPNFYLLPTPDLDRGFLLEFREFMLMATERFRWLLGAVDQAGTGILDVFADWLNIRRRMYPSLGGSDMRHYYRTPEFKVDFIEFLRVHPTGNDEKVRFFIEFEQAVLRAPAPDSSRLSNAIRLEPAVELDWADIPVREGQSRVIKLVCDFQRALDTVARCDKADWESDHAFHVVFQEAYSKNAIYHVSSQIAKLLEACNGQNAIGEIASLVSTEMADIPEPLRDYACVSLLEELRSRGLVAIYRTASQAAASQNGGSSICEYSEINADASEQNLSSVHAQ